MVNFFIHVQCFACLHVGCDSVLKNTSYWCLHFFFFHSITFMEGSKTLSSHYVVSVVVQFEVSAISLRAVTAIIVPIHDQLLMIYYSFMLM